MIKLPFVAVFLIFLSSNVWAKYNVCSVTINSPEETQTFQKHLSKKDFEFTELTDYCGGDPDCGDRWLDIACENNVKCDVLLISGHFGGTFFGDKGMQLGLDKMEQMSCKPGCEGIFNQPKEVFLFGCNTLASKEADHRTPEEYRQVLIEDGIDATDAERIAQARYGALGSSFRERMQRVFSQVPSVYGFDSVGPSGKTIKPFLDRYFKRAGDYAQLLEKYEVEQAVDLINQTNGILDQDYNNLLLAEVLRDTAFTQCEGVSPDDSAYALKKDLCALYDPNKTPEQKVELIKQLLRGENNLVFFSAISNYLDFFDGEISPQAFKSLKDDPVIMENLNAVSRAFENYPTLSIDLIKLKLKLGLIDDSQYRKVIKKTMEPGLKRLAREDVDLICSLREQIDAFPLLEVELSDFDPKTLKSERGFEALFCSRTNDPRITKFVLDNLSSLKGDKLNGGMWLLSELPGYEKEKLEFARKKVKDPASRNGAYHLLMLHGDIAERKSTLSDILKGELLDENMWLLDGIDYSEIKDEQFALQAARRLGPMAPNWILSDVIVENLDSNSKSWKTVLDLYDRADISDPGFELIIATEHFDNAELSAWAFKHAFSAEHKDPEMSFLSILSSSSMSDGLKKELFSILAKNPEGKRASAARGILLSQKSVLYSESERQLLQGSAYFVDCKKESDGFHCSAETRKIDSSHFSN